MNEYKYQRLNPELSIYRQKGSKNYYIRMWVKDGNGKGRNHVKSLRTPDKEEAIKEAWGQFFSYKHKLTPEFFMSNQSSLISSIGKELLQNFETKSKKIYVDYARILRKEIIPELGKIKIKELDKATIRTYLTKFARSTTQLRIRRTTLNHLFDLAEEKKLIKNNEVPKFPSIEVESDEERSTFSKEHLTQLNVMYSTFEDSSRKAITKRYRKLFRLYMNFLLSTGVRAGEEALNIKFSDVSYEPSKKIYKLRITKGKIHSRKKSSFREIPLDSDTVNLIAKVCTIFYGAEGLADFKNKLSSAPKDNFIFRLPEKQNLKPQYEKMFEALCKSVDLDKNTHSYTLYSYRHTYITNKLKEGIDVYLLATHCGTSIEMIQRYYSKLTAVMRAPELIGDFEKQQRLEDVPF